MRRHKRRHTNIDAHMFLHMNVYIYACIVGTSTCQFCAVEQYVNAYISVYSLMYMHACIANVPCTCHIGVEAGTFA